MTFNRSDYLSYATHTSSYGCRDQAFRLQPSGQNRQKNSLKCIFVINSALKIQCHIVKNTLLQTAFSVILSAGKEITLTTELIITKHDVIVVYRHVTAK